MKGSSVRHKLGKNLGLLILAAIAIALMRQLSFADDFKVGYLYVGPVDDYGYNYAQNQARLMVEKEVPGVTTQYVENVPENADADARHGAHDQRQLQDDLCDQLRLLQ